MKKGIFFSTILCLATLFISCEDEIEIRANADGSTNINVFMDLGQVITETIQEIADGISSITADATTGEIKIFDAAEMKKFFNNGLLKNVQTSCPTPTSAKISGLFPASNSSGENSKYNALNDFVTCTPHALSLTLDPKNIRKFTSSFTETEKDVVDLLMAPVFENDPMEHQEYCDILESVYGADIVNDMKKSVMKFTLEAPDGKIITSCQLGGAKILKQTKSKVQFTISTLDLLCLEETRIFTIKY